MTRRAEEEGLVQEKDGVATLTKTGETAYMFAKGKVPVNSTHFSKTNDKIAALFRMAWKEASENETF